MACFKLLSSFVPPPTVHGVKTQILNGGADVLLHVKKVSCRAALDSTYKEWSFNGRERERDSPDGIVFEDGIFNISKEEEEEEEEEEDPPSFRDAPNYAGKRKGLIPDEWKPLQIELTRTKKDRKKDILAEELENARRKELQGRLRRQKIVDNDELQGTHHEAQVNWSTIAPDSEAQVNGSKIAPDSEAQDNGPTIHSDSKDQENGSTIGPDFEAVDVLRSSNQASTAPSRRAVPKNPRLALGEVTMEDVAEKIREMIFAEEEEQPLADQELESLLTPKEKVLLRRKGPDFNKVSSETWVLLHTLAMSGQIYLLDELLKRDTDINAVDKDGLTALQKAVLCRREISARQLLRAGADVEVRDKYGASLLHYAVQTGSMTMLKTLLKHGLSVNSVDENGWSPLHLAVQSGREDIVKLLLLKGADKKLENKDRVTPLDICLAIGRGFNAYAVAKVLKKYPKEDPIHP